jgi:uncharacterized membrane protein
MQSLLKLKAQPKNLFIWAVTALLLLAPQLAMAQVELTWTNESSDITNWFNTIIQVIMAVFVMTAIVMGSLAFKQLAADGNWKDFWSKIAGAMGMFVVPIAIYWIRDQ